MENLFDKLREYCENGRIPMHMPGHKRETGFFTVPEAQKIDITEIDGFDDYHHPQGILRESMERAAFIYGTKKTYYLVNGSTCGILAAISGTVTKGSPIIAARNCHKAVAHAVELRELEPVYIYPQIIEDLWISGAIDPENVEKLLISNPRAEAVVITSPTYEGVVSDVERIAQVVHRYCKILIVDEAHGAHFPFSGDFPKSAVYCGADIVIQSLHKTLPCYTQTAVLHICSDRVDAQRIQKYLGIYQTSSPSYIFLAAMEQCISYMDTKGRQKMKEYFLNLSELRGRLSETKGVRLLCSGGGMYDYDPSKIVLSGENAQTGKQIADIMRKCYQIEPELAADNYVVLMTSLCDRKEWYDRIAEAAEGIAAERGNITDSINAGETEIGSFRAKVRMTPKDVLERDYEDIGLGESVGRISAQEVYVYPPGIPIVVPGEEITRDCLKIIEKHKANGLLVKGLTGQEEEKIRCIK